MKAAYVGILTPGSTSRMRAEWLRELTPDLEWQWIDIDVPMQKARRIYKSLAFRHQIGPVVHEINRLVRNGLQSQRFELVWVDKAVFLTPATVDGVRNAAQRMVHFTPDTAFHENRSRYFRQSISSFDLAVTTKSFEVRDYRRLIPEERIWLTTQGFNPRVHYARNDDRTRQREVVFVGLAESDRESCVAKLLGAGIRVRLGGLGWSRFVNRHRRSGLLEFIGENVFGDAYADALSASWVGIGLLSKRFPELHTTRTFEIPACGAILATEPTSDTLSFFDNGEALFFGDYDDLCTNVLRLFSESDASLRTIAAAGNARVINDGRDYPTILSKILSARALAF